MGNHSITARTYSAAEAAAILGVGKSTLCRAVREGRAEEYRAIRIGRTVRFPRYIIDEMTGAAA